MASHKLSHLPFVTKDNEDIESLLLEENYRIQIDPRPFIFIPNEKISLNKIQKNSSPLGSLIETISGFFFNVIK
jgi:DNA-binding transcriptional regulator/RsmH inhibitor MraZ